MSEELDMRKGSLEFLCCPVCHGDLRLTVDETLNDVFLSGSLECDSCRRTYKIESGIPDFLLPEMLDERDKKWMLKPKFKMRLREHDVLVQSLADIGRKLGFNVHADLDGYRQTAFPFSTVNPDRVKEIDVVFYSSNKADAVFEVENTTGITEAIVRSGNIPDCDTKRIIVIPDERKRFLRSRLREPMLRDQIAKNNWYMITYDDLQAFIDSKHPSMDALTAKLKRLGDFKLDSQSSMQKFMGK